MSTSVQPVLRRDGEYPPSPAPREVAGLRRDAFFVEVDFPNVPINGQQIPVPFTVDADADLVITGGQATVTTVADRTTLLAFAPLYAKIRRTAAGRDSTSDFVPLANLVSFSQIARPARWEAPLLLRANSQFVTTLFLAAGAAPLYVSITYNAYKVFTVGA